MNMPVINLEDGRPTADEAVRKMNFAMRMERGRGAKAIKLIHGYGSTGVGGRIKSEVRRALAAKKRAGEIREYIPGEEFSPFYESCQKALMIVPQLPQDKDYNRCNQGITIVVMK